MKFKRSVKPAHGFDTINFAPLIFVIFQLCILFVLSSSFTFQSGIDVKLPRAVTSDIIKEEGFVITINGEDIIYLDNKIVSIPELSRELKKLSAKNQPVLIKADRRSSMGTIVDVWNACRNLKIEHINIATNQEK